MLTNDQLDLWDRDHFFHPSTHLAQHARGETPSPHHHRRLRRHIRTATATRFLDAFAGLYCVNVGYGRTEIAEAIAEQAQELAYYHAYVGHGTEASITLANMILERAPKGMSKVYFGLGGSDANETNVKIGLVLQQRPRPAGEEEDHLALARLPRLRPRHRLADRPRSSSTTSSTCRCDRHPPHRGALLLPPPRRRR